MIKKGLGKGLGALIENASSDNQEGSIKELRINEIEPNLNQPRKRFDDEKLVQLAESIKQHGIVQPIIVKSENGVYKIVAGERRWRAARIAGLNVVPVIVRELSNRQVMEIALIENIQREDLNPIEEAEAYEKLLKEYKMTQEEISNAVGKSRSLIANFLRLLGLTEKVKNYVVSGELSNGHARALVVLENSELQEKAADMIIEKKLNVRETENMVKKLLTKNSNENKKHNDIQEYLDIEDKLKNVFGTKVKLLSNKKKGKIMIEYYSLDELDRILEIIDKMGQK